MHKSLLGVLVLFISFTSLLAQQTSDQFGIAERPAWVKPTDYHYKKDIPSTATSVYPLLVDMQFHAEKDAYYRRYAVHILNEQGLEQESEFSISFDPAFQRVQVHAIEVTRNGERINKLDAKDFSVIQRETGSSQLQYDGRLTIVNHLTDIQVGDVLMYDYSIVGTNPIFEGKFSAFANWQYTLPVEKLQLRVLHHPKRELQVQADELPDLIKKESRLANGLNEIIWSRSGVEMLQYDSETPYWYDATPSLQLTEYKSWNEVVAQLADKYQVKGRLTEKNWQELSKKLFSQYDEQEDKINKLIHYVQNEIRYLGLEGGLNAYKPHAPHEVLQRKFGDCKDKAVLLCALLDRLSVKAVPALVNTSLREAVEDYKPSPTLFDHCIVQFSFQDSTYWVDATRSSQGGDFRTMSIANYRKALLIDAQTTTLSVIPEYPTDHRKITSYFTLALPGETTRLSIISRYKGYEAETTRSYVKETSLTKIGEQYLNFYARIFPYISEEKPLKFRDRPHYVETEESYLVDSLWQLSDAGSGSYLAEFYPLYLNSILQTPSQVVRTMPFALNYPLQIEENILVELPEDWMISTDNQEIENEFFRFRAEEQYSPPMLTANYTFELLQDHVPADKISMYIKEIEKVQNTFGFQLTYGSVAGERISYPLLFIVLLFVGGCIYGFIRLYKQYDPKPACDLSTRPAIGGWMVLPLIGLFITAPRIGYELVSWDYFNAGTLHQFFDAGSIVYNPTLGLTIVFEVLFNSFRVLAAVFLIVLFLKKRSSLPILMQGYYLVGLIGVAIDNMLVMHLNLLSSAETTELWGELVKMLISVAIWLPYFRYSERVKETFIYRYSNNELPPRYLSETLGRTEEKGKTIKSNSDAASEE